MILDGLRAWWRRYRDAARLEREACARGCMVLDGQIVPPRKSIFWISRPRFVRAHPAFHAALRRARWAAGRRRRLGWTA